MMVSINLLPWRSHQRQQQRYHQKLAIVGGIVLAGLCWGILHFIFQEYLNTLHQHCLEADKKITNTQAKAEKTAALIRQVDQLAQQINQIKLLQKQQKNTINRMQEIASLETLPIIFHSMSVGKNNLILHGETVTLQVVRALIAKINNTNYLSVNQFKEIKQYASPDKYMFSLMVNLKQEKGSNA